MADRLSQEVIEALLYGDPNARVSQDVAEALIQASSTARVSQFAVEILNLPLKTPPRAVRLMANFGVDTERVDPLYVNTFAVGVGPPGASSVSVPCTGLQDGDVLVATFVNWTGYVPTVGQSGWTVVGGAGGWWGAYRVWRNGDPTTFSWSVPSNSYMQAVISVWRNCDTQHISASWHTSSGAPSTTTVTPYDATARDVIHFALLSTGSSISIGAPSGYTSRGTPSAANGLLATMVTDRSMGPNPTGTVSPSSASGISSSAALSVALVGAVKPMAHAARLMENVKPSLSVSGRAARLVHNSTVPSASAVYGGIVDKGAIAPLGSGSNSRTITLSANAPASSGLVLCVQLDAVQTWTTVTDSRGNTWTRDAYNDNSPGSMAVFHTNMNVAQLLAGDTITVNLSLAKTEAVNWILAYTVRPITLDKSATGFSSASPSGLTTAMTIASSEVAFMFGGSGAATLPTLSAASPATLADSVTNGTYLTSLLEYENLTTTETCSETMTHTGGAIVINYILVTYRSSILYQDANDFAPEVDSYNVLSMDEEISGAVNPADTLDIGYQKLWSDNFNRANEDPLSGGGVWSGFWGGNLRLVSNQVNSSNNGSSYYNVQKYFGDIAVEATYYGMYIGEFNLLLHMTTGASPSGYACRVAPGSASGDRYTISRVDAGTYTTLATTLVNPGLHTDNITVYHFERRGNKLTLFVDWKGNGQWTKVLEAQDSKYLGGYVGLKAAATYTWDNFAITTPLTGSIGSLPVDAMSESVSLAQRTADKRFPLKLIAQGNINVAGTQTFHMPVTADQDGGTVVLLIGATVNETPLASVTDSKSNTYTLLEDQGTGLGGDAVAYKCEGGTRLSAGDTIDITPNSYPGSTQFLCAAYSVDGTVVGHAKHSGSGEAVATGVGTDDVLVSFAYGQYALLVDDSATRILHADWTPPNSTYWMEVAYKDEYGVNNPVDGVLWNTTGYYLGVISLMIAVPYLYSTMTDGMGFTGTLSQTLGITAPVEGMGDTVSLVGTIADAMGEDITSTSNQVEDNLFDTLENVQAMDEGTAETLTLVAESDQPAEAELGDLYSLSQELRDALWGEPTVERLTLIAQLLIAMDTVGDESENMWLQQRSSLDILEVYEGFVSETRRLVQILVDSMDESIRRDIDDLDLVMTNVQSILEAADTLDLWQQLIISMDEVIPQVLETMTLVQTNVQSLLEDADIISLVQTNVQTLLEYSDSLRLVQTNVQTIVEIIETRGLTVADPLLLSQENLQFLDDTIGLGYIETLRLSQRNLQYIIETIFNPQQVDPNAKGIEMERVPLPVGADSYQMKFKVGFNAQTGDWLHTSVACQGYVGANRYGWRASKLLSITDGTEGANNKIDHVANVKAWTGQGLTDDVPLSIHELVCLKEDVNSTDIATVIFEAPGVANFELGPRSVVLSVFENRDSAHAYTGRFLRINNRTGDVLPAPGSAGWIEDYTIVEAPGGDQDSTPTGTGSVNQTAVMPGEDRLWSSMDNPPQKHYYSMPVSAVACRHGTAGVPSWFAAGYPGMNWLFEGFTTDAIYHSQLRDNFQKPSSSDVDMNVTWTNNGYRSVPAGVAALSILGITTNPANWYGWADICPTAECYNQWWNGSGGGVGGGQRCCTLWFMQLTNGTPPPGDPLPGAMTQNCAIWLWGESDGNGLYAYFPPTYGNPGYWYSLEAWFITDCNNNLLFAYDSGDPAYLAADYWNFYCASCDDSGGGGGPPGGGGGGGGTEPPLPPIGDGGGGGVGVPPEPPPGDESWGVPIDGIRVRADGQGGTGTGHGGDSEGMGRIRFRAKQ